VGTSLKVNRSISDKWEAGIKPRFSVNISHTEVARAQGYRRSRSRLMRVRIAEESHNFPCSLFLFDFDAKRKSRTEKEKHE